MHLDDISSLVLLQVIQFEEPSPSHLKHVG
jgi:hypothetical protein